uniref:Uncharacterized protein n=1 Tax=Anguilla anguilla TaxID=7936 RepID=A0A0E9R7S7_ANGAN
MVQRSHQSNGGRVPPKRGMESPMHALSHQTLWVMIEASETKRLFFSKTIPRYYPWSSLISFTHICVLIPQGH